VERENLKHVETFALRIALAILGTAAGYVSIVVTERATTSEWYFYGDDVAFLIWQLVPVFLGALLVASGAIRPAGAIWVFSTACAGTALAHAMSSSSSTGSLLLIVSPLIVTFLTIFAAAFALLDRTSESAEEGW
jgi:hypothetical protein